MKNRIIKSLAALISVLFLMGSNLTDHIIIDYNGVVVGAIIDAPSSKEVDVVLAFHGTTMDDTKIVHAAKMILRHTKKLIKKDNVMIISVAYPEEGLLMGENIREAEAALLWTKNRAEKELNISIKKIFLIGHSQGGYLVTRLNTMHKTDGVIANGAGPIDLGFRCKFDESGKIKNKEQKKYGSVCAHLKKKYGSVFDNSPSYSDHSMINYTSKYKSKILFIQGMKDKKIQMILWPRFKEKLSKCKDCAEYKILEIENAGHGAAFSNYLAKKAINSFLED